MIGIIYPKDSWILNKIGKELIKIEGVLDNKRADITYWINWIYWRHFRLEKGNFDIVFFTHFDNDDITILNRADLIICMSAHGKNELLRRGIKESKIEVCPYFGVSIEEKKKITIGTSGRDYATNRKNRQELERLKEDLSDVFEFKHTDITDDKFFQSIDYFLQTSLVEGGSMDILNAIYARVPVVSRDIGFIYSLKTDTDFIYKDYGELFLYFKDIENDIEQKDRVIKNCTWDNFRNWHIELFNRLGLE